MNSTRLKLGRNRIRIGLVFWGSDPDPVLPWRSDSDQIFSQRSDPVKIHPDPQPWLNLGEVRSRAKIKTAIGNRKITLKYINIFCTTFLFCIERFKLRFTNNRWFSVYCMLLKAMNQFMMFNLCTILSKAESDAK